MARNPFIVVEGIDAAGSSTQAALLAKRVKKEGLRPLELSFPQDDRKTGQLIYDKFLNTKKMGTLSRREQALLYIADFYSRTDDIQAVMAGKDAEHDIVVSDRWCTSTFAYQTMGLTGEQYRKMHAWLQHICFEGKPQLARPDAVIFLDTAVATAQSRLRGKKRDYFEASRKKQLAVRSSYLRLARSWPKTWHVVDHDDATGAARTKQALHAEIWDIVQARGLL